jgi:hypothetical protein
MIAMTASAPIDRPTGGFQWTAELRAQLPVIRGIRVPKVEETADGWSSRPSFAEPTDAMDQRRIQEHWAKLAQATELEGKALWTEAEASEMLKAERLRDPDPGYWREIFAQCAAHEPEWRKDRQHLKWAIRAAGATHSLAFATRVVLDAGDIFKFYTPYGWLDTFEPLRHALAAAPEDAHRAALRVAEEFRGRARELDCIISFLFPEQRAWAEECVARGPSYGESRWLNQTILSAEAARGLPDPEFPTLLLQLHLHGEAALPFLESLLDSGWRERVLELLARLHSPAVLPILAARIKYTLVRDTLAKFAERWPAAVFESILARATLDRFPEAEQWLRRLAARKLECLDSVLATRAPAEQSYFEALLAPLRVPEAPPDALPELLRNPPWTRKDRPKPVPDLDIAPLEEADAMVWPAGLREQWLRNDPSPRMANWYAREQERNPALTVEKFALEQLLVLGHAHERILAGGPMEPGDLAPIPWNGISPSRLFLLPDPLRPRLWNSLPPSLWSTVSWEKFFNLSSALPALMARHGLSCLPGLATFAAARPEEGLAFALPFRAARLAPIAARAFRHLKRTRPHAMAWLRAHPETAAVGLIPLAFGKDKADRDNARHTLRWLVTQGFESAVRQAGDRYGAAAAGAVDLLLKADPVLVVPARMPMLPDFFEWFSFHRPRLKSGGALPLAAAEHLGRMLTISKLDDPYAGLETVKAACTAESLARFAWDGFEAWLGAGAPGKEGWAYTALGLLGDDETARRLAPKIREWPTEGAYARAVLGLDILAAIGTDMALMHLDGIARKVKSRPLQNKAREKILQIAEARELTPEQLADRLIPDLGLDERGTALLDFGPRRFTVGFDETLTPHVRDEAGARLKGLPKPNKHDDAERASAAVERLKAIKQGAKAVASLQIFRLEQAMGERRRWTSEEFRRLFLDHPVMRHLARRLVWGVYRDGQLADAFRVAEDLTLADRHDGFYELPADAAVGLVHALELPDGLSRDFGQIFGDYEILQPFKQLGRETYALTDEERRTGRIQRFRDRKFATGAVLGLANRGWARGEVDDYRLLSLVKRLPEELDAELYLDPGTFLGNPAEYPEQTIYDIVVRRPGTTDDDRLAGLADVDPIVVSEIIRDADLLAPPKN